MKNRFIYLMVFAIISACKDPNSEPIPVIETSPVAFHMHSYWDEDEIYAYDGSVHTDANTGRKASINIGQFYFTNIVLTKADGSLIKLKDTLVLKNEGETYIVGNAPVGNYSKLSFEVGIDSISNLKSNPGNSSLNESSMWFSKTAQASDYIGFNFSGLIDTTEDASGEATIPYSYKIGNSNVLCKVSMPTKAFSVEPKISNYVHLIADFSIIFNGVKLSDNANLIFNGKKPNDSELGKKLLYNISKMFRYE